MSCGAKRIVHDSCFDSERYVEEQTKCILERIERFDNKLYLEFGGKLLFDYHASRVLPGFNPNGKMKILQRLGDKLEIIVCIYAGDIEKKKIRADFGHSYEADTAKLMDDLGMYGLHIGGVVITRFEGQEGAMAFKKKLEKRGVRVYLHEPIPGYPSEVDTVVSEKGYGRNSYVETSRPLVVVTAPGPNSGKMATCLSQIYHEYAHKGSRAGYAKFETFPIWNFPLLHPVNVAYEAATADLKDVNMIDPFHKEAYGEISVNYNRDVAAFPLLHRILVKILGSDVYKSPTDMGVNRIGYAISDDEGAQRAGKQELIRRYYRYACDHVLGRVEADVVERCEELLDRFNLDKSKDRAVVEAAREKSKQRPVVDRTHSFLAEGVSGTGCAIQLYDDKQTIITGTTPSSMVLNAIKFLAGIPDHLDLISDSVINSVGRLKKDILMKGTDILTLEETLLVLAVGPAMSPVASSAMEQLEYLKGCEVHLTFIPRKGDEDGLRVLQVNLTTDPLFATKNLLL